jgi:hypothetical protein
MGSDQYLVAKVLAYDNRGLQADERFDGTVNYLAPLAGRGDIEASIQQRLPPHIRQFYAIRY